MNDILTFQGEHRFLSNFYLINLVHKSKRYRSSEHLYQSLKMKYSLDAETVRMAFSPNDAKKLGGQLTLRDDFLDIRNDIMYYVVKLKFFKHPTMRDKLLQTGDAYLEEGNHWHDNYWGVCSCKKCVNKPKLNNLGKIIMRVRNELKEINHV